MGITPVVKGQTSERDKGAVSLPLFVGAGVTATGGPLALVALFIPQTFGASSSVALAVLTGTVAFGVPVAIWYRYSGQVASSGGLFSFVEAAAGRRVAFVQGGIWTISYFLYLPYTIAYIVYDLLPVVVAGIGPYRPALEILLPIALISLGFLPIRRTLLIVAGVALLQLVLLTALVIASSIHGGPSLGGFSPQSRIGPLARGAANSSLLYVCTSLPLFFGGETTQRNATVKRGLVVGFGLSALFVLFGVLVWAHATPSALRAPIPGVALARAAWGHGFAMAVGLGVVVSVTGVVIAEYLALSRLLHTMWGRSLPKMTALVAGGFLVASGLSLIDPGAFYDVLLKPSLVALWVSQFLVFAVYPRFAKLHHSLTPIALGLAIGASALMAYGLYSTIT